MVKGLRFSLEEKARRSGRQQFKSPFGDCVITQKKGFLSFISLNSLPVGRQGYSNSKRGI
jgi:hypothetical protein